ncbi:MAG: S1 family peptidase [Dokdonella sp.]|nr:S1 family peptidase [Dokdonella sp.]
MNAKHSVLALACVALYGAGIAGAAASDLPGSTPTNPLSAEQALDLDAAWVANASGIAPETARARLLIQRAAGPIAERVRTQYADRLAGLYIEHEPTSRLVVRLTGYDAVRPEFHNVSGHNLEVVYVLGADHALADLQQRFDVGFHKLQARMPEVESGYVDERTGEVVIEVLRDAKSPRVADLQRAAGGAFGVPTRVVQVDEPLVNQTLQGSGRLDFSQGLTLTYCTNAFVVETIASPKTYGTVTAGHCQADSGTYAYTGVDGATHSLSYVSQKFDADTDIRWASIAGGVSNVAATFYASGAYRTVNGVLTKAATLVGQTMCGYGTATTNKCGTVQSTAYNPGSICGPGVVIGSGTNTCNASFVRVDAAGGACQAGDSGGPWFDTNLAAGVHKAGTMLGSRCVYTSIDDIGLSPLGLQIHL